MPKQILTGYLSICQWNSSRLEGNTYSLLDTTRLIELGEAAEGRDRLEAQNDRQPQGGDRIPRQRRRGDGFTRYTISNFTAFWRRSLVPTLCTRQAAPQWPSVSGMAYHPLEMPQFDR